MTAIDWPTLINWVIQGAISLVLGIVGGFVGTRIKHNLEAKREREREQKERTVALTAGMSDFVEETRRRELQDVIIIGHDVIIFGEGAERTWILHVASILFLLLVFLFLAFKISPLAGFAFLFLLGLTLGTRWNWPRSQRRQSGHRKARR